MFQVTRKADYAIRLMLDLAASPGDLVSTAEIARRQDIPYQFLRKVVQELVVGRLLIAERGMNGGLRLARRADRVSLLDILRAVDTTELNNCVVDPMRCERRAICAAYPVWQEAQRGLEQVLAAATLSEVLKGWAERKVSERSGQVARPGQAKVTTESVRKARYGPGAGRRSLTLNSAQHRRPR